jgi:hypothetical protein
MIPSGYKEDTVYSAVPTDGSGDLSFTRASNGTRVNSAGLVEVCPWNLLEQSEAFSNTSIWNVLNGASVSANTAVAPNGTTTADTLTFTTNPSSNVFCYPSAPIGKINVSVYAKTASGTKQFALRVDLPSGTTSPNFTATTEWQRFDFEVTTTVANLVFYIINGSSGTAGSIFIWGAQVNIGSTAKPYFPTTDRLNVPRLTYQNGGGGCPSLLLEKQSTNFQTYSQDFTNVAWTKLGQGVGDTSVVTANYAISPDGTQNATRFVCNLNGGTTSSDRSWMIASFTAQATSTISIWIKLNSAGTKTVLLSDSGGGTKTISGTDWQRIDATFVGAGGEFRIGLIGGSTSDTLDCCIWGAQAESGSYPTSYIPTTSASATRVADACFKTGISSLIGQTEGVLYWDGVAAQGNYNQLMFIKDSSANQFIGITVGTQVIYGEIYNAGYVQLFQYSIGANDTTFKMALAYKTNDFVFYINGVQVASASTGTTPTSFDDFYLGNTNNLRDVNCQVKEAILFPTRLTNAELASLTTL